MHRNGRDLLPIAIAEHKAPTKLRTADEMLRAAEQGLYVAVALGANIAITTNGQRWFYVDVRSSLAAGKIEYFTETRNRTPAAFHHRPPARRRPEEDPKPLAEKVWQIIWHATKEEPRACLLTFVEIFVLKFLVGQPRHCETARSLQVL